MLWIEKANRMRQLQMEALSNIEERRKLYVELENDAEFKAWAESKGDPNLCLIDDLVGDIDEALLHEQRFEETKKLFCPARFVDSNSDPCHPLQGLI